MAFLHAQFAKWTLSRAKASQFMQVPFSLPAQNHGRAPSSVQLAATRKMRWKANAQAESKFYSFLTSPPDFSSLVPQSNFILFSSLPPSGVEARLAHLSIPFPILVFQIKLLFAAIFWATWLLRSRIGWGIHVCNISRKSTGNRWLIMILKIDSFYALHQCSCHLVFL